MPVLFDLDICGNGAVAACTDGEGVDFKMYRHFLGIELVLNA